ncbi:hypothetical protein KSX_93130 [Ktedonospora formicarum]|uniref:Uncharacterized protein n=1 Tax=Ktedonospora formicarum TaxID=2778364 RepID=A0A8J3IDE3_9CHLR|nr:hypothetical protein KSX_93130 [Ktedonospora formicarum]
MRGSVWRVDAIGWSWRAREKICFKVRVTAHPRFLSLMLVHLLEALWGEGKGG